MINQSPTRLLVSSIFFLGATAAHGEGIAHDTRAGLDAARAVSTTVISADDPIRVRNAMAVRTFLHLLEEKNIPAWGELWAEEGRQDMPYAPPGFPKSLVGKARLMEHFSGLPAAMEYLRFPDLKLHLTDDPNVVIAEFRGDIKVANSNKKYDNTYINVFTFRADGKLTHVKEYFNPLVLIEGGAFEHGAPKAGR